MEGDDKKNYGGKYLQGRGGGNFDPYWKISRYAPSACISSHLPHIDSQYYMLREDFSHVAGNPHSFFSWGGEVLINIFLPIFFAEYKFSVKLRT